MNKLIVISGCSGGGESALLTELSNNGYSVVPEVGREIVKEQLEVGGDILPWKKPDLFCEKLIERSVLAYHKANKMITATGQVVFFDRSFLEGISYFQSLNDNRYDHLIDELRYYPVILMTPPWKEIYCQDSERKHSFEDAVNEYGRLLKSYPAYGYQVVEIPKTSVEERYKFVVSITNKNIG